uniref:Uncharacterized protein n=1 Tax=Strombidinopsis acuminata TaxID=141414 RepID=A0A7S3X9K5_9SPIT|mmetsp:Transcript_95558/g.131423  ORF Transcript_95558/g.131423 Transcript_95558/m.131423 type:complete len:158 (+) Transcript_95558:26-499(+)
MSNKQLKKKLVAGKNEQVDGYDKFAMSQYFENLTKEQYSGDRKNRITPFNASADTLNPLLNRNTLVARLQAIDHYHLQHGLEHYHWPHYFMRNVAQRVWKYKFNYGLKAFCIYTMYADIRAYDHLRKSKFTDFNDTNNFVFSFGGHGAATAAVFLFL